MENTAKLKQPKGLYLLSFLASFERFGFYGITPFLIFYMTNSANSDIGGLGLVKSYAGNLFYIFYGLCYLFPLLGGWLSDKYIGQRKSVQIGSVLITAGMFICAIHPDVVTLMTGLITIAIGNGFFKSTHISMIGELYEQGDKRRDSAFTLYYMIFNVSAIAAPIVCSSISYAYGYKFGFLLAGCMMLFGVIVYSLLAKKYLGDVGLTARNKTVYQDNKVVAKTPLTKEEKDRIFVIFAIIFFVTFFWAGFFQAPGSFNIFAKQYINRMIFHWELPAEWLQSLNPFFVVFLSPVFSLIWLTLSKKGKNPSTPVKMAIGMLFLGLGFLLMMGAVAQRGGNVADPAIKAALMWMIGTYFLHTLGELCLSPIGLSMITKLAPARMASSFMAVWFLGLFVASQISSLIFGFVSSMGASQVFTFLAAYFIGLAIIVFLLSKKLVAMMHGRD